MSSGSNVTPRIGTDGAVRENSRTSIVCSKPIPRYVNGAEAALGALFTLRGAESMPEMRVEGSGVCQG